MAARTQNRIAWRIEESDLAGRRESSAVRRELAIPTVCVYGAALPYDWSTCAKGQNPSSLLVGSPRLLFLFTIFLSWRSEPLNLLRAIRLDKLALARVTATPYTAKARRAALQTLLLAAGKTLGRVGLDSIPKGIVCGAAALPA